jgi:hypothetical protein
VHQWAYLGLVAPIQRRTVDSRSRVGKQGVTNRDAERIKTY